MSARYPCGSPCDRSFLASGPCTQHRKYCSHYQKQLQRRSHRLRAQAAAHHDAQSGTSESLEAAPEPQYKRSRTDSEPSPSAGTAGINLNASIISFIFGCDGHSKLFSCIAPCMASHLNIYSDRAPRCAPRVSSCALRIYSCALLVSSCALRVFPCALPSSDGMQRCQLAECD